MILTNHFKLSEFAVSADYPELAAEITFTEVEKERIRFFCSNVLEPLRSMLSRPIQITSGKRTVELNQAVGGHPHSHHLFQEDHGACDIVVEGVDPESIATILLNTAIVRTIIIYKDFLHLSFTDKSEVVNQVKTGE